MSKTGVDRESAEEFVEELKSNFDSIELDPFERAMVDYATKLTRSPQSIRSDDITVLRSVGFDDRAIHDCCSVVAYFAFVNRVADGLGVELESEDD